MLQLLNRPFNFTGYNFRTKCNIALATGSFVMLFLWLFDNETKLSVLAFADNGAIVCISQLLFLVAFHHFFVKNKINGTVKVWQYLACVSAGVWVCFSFMYLYVNPVYFKTAYSFKVYINYINDNLPFVFPFLLFAVAIDYIFMLNGRLRKEAILSVPAEQAIAVTDNFVLNDESGRPIFNIQKSNLLFIRSADNYIEIFYLTEQKSAKKLIRYQLSSVESNPQHNFLYKVHRYYLCNLQKVTGISGGLQNCILHFDSSMPSIPVSRAKAKEVMQIVNGN